MSMVSVLPTPLDNVDGRARRSMTSSAAGVFIDPKAAWRHPALRIGIALLIWAHDMFIFGEDPVNDSHVEANVPGMGNVLSFLTFWAVPHAGFGVLRILLLVLSASFGVVFGRQVVHGMFLRDRCKISMFGWPGTRQALYVNCPDDANTERSRMVNGRYDWTSEQSGESDGDDRSRCRRYEKKSNGVVMEFDPGTKRLHCRSSEESAQHEFVFTSVRRFDVSFPQRGAWTSVDGDPALKIDVRGAGETRGSILIMAITMTFFLYVGSMVYNVFLPADSEHLISGASGLQMRHFAKMTQCFSVTADLVAVMMILDTVFQDTKHHPVPWQQIWSEWYGGWVRVVVVWTCFSVSLSVNLAGILTSGHGGGYSWDNRVVGGFTEFSRSLFVSSIIFLDLFTVMQDYDFPKFYDQQTSIKIAGTFSDELKCACGCGVTAALQGLRWHRCLAEPRWFRRNMPGPHFWRVEITGKWLTFGPLFLVICLDLFCARNQIFYDPINYGQYVDPSTDRIWTIVDKDYLALAYDNGWIVSGREHLISFAARRHNVTGEALDNSSMSDVELNSRYIGSSAKWLGLALGLGFITGFLVLLICGDDRHKKDEDFRARLSKTVGEVSKTLSGGRVDLSRPQAPETKIGWSENGVGAAGAAGAVCR